MPELHELSQDKRLRNHFNIDKRRRTSRHYQPEAHFHSYYELYYLIDGACRFFVLDTMYTLSPGDLMICAPGEYHRNSYYGPKMHDRFTVYFDTLRITEDLAPYIGFLPVNPDDQRQYHIPEKLQEDFLSCRTICLPGTSRIRSAESLSSLIFFRSICSSSPKTPYLSKRITRRPARQTRPFRPPPGISRPITAIRSHWNRYQSCPASPRPTFSRKFR